MTDQLYQDRIVALAKAKTGAGKLASPTKSARRDNPLCGDRVVIDVRLDEAGKIAEIAHQVRGCLLCQASASALASVAVGRNAPASRRSASTPSGRSAARRAKRASRSRPSPRSRATSRGTSACCCRSRLCRKRSQSLGEGQA